MKWFPLLLAMAGSASAHQNHGHKKQAGPPAEALARINADYLQSVKAIFQKSCFDCHSASTRYPWYAGLPIAKGMIESDVREAKEHLDLTADFPFGGHGTPREDLEAIGKEVAEGEMPPFRYRLLHWKNGLSPTDRQAIQEWVQRSLALIPEPSR